MTNTNTQKAVRITKAMRFADIANLLQGVAVETIERDGVEVERTTIQEALDFIAKEVDSLSRKNKSNGEKKLTPTQEQNEVLKEKILAFLAEQENPVTCGDVWKGIPDFEANGFQNQKASVLLNKLYNNGNGPVAKTHEKGKTFFSLAYNISADEEEDDYSEEE